MGLENPLKSFSVKLFLGESMVFIAFIPSGKGGAQIWGIVTEMPANEKDGIRIRGLYTHEFEIIKDYFKEELQFPGSVYHSENPGAGFEKSYTGKDRTFFKITSDLDISGVE